MLQSAITHVLALKDLRPSQRVNRAFGNLVSSVIEDNSQATYSLREMAAVRKVCADSESELEIYWAERIIAVSDAASELALFPYVDNYFELVQRELQLLADSGLQLAAKARMLMIGSGPLPMTALEISKQTGAKIDHLDNSKRAIELCGQVSQRLNIDCGHIYGDGRTVKLTKRYDLILVAGLAGETLGDKQSIIDNILPALAKNGRILVRSAHGARALLYPEVAPDGLKNVELLSQYHPTDEVINSVLIYKALKEK